MTESLLLPSLKISNYRGLDGLDVSTLGRVNLIVGENNVGKTSLLEAVWLWAARGEWDVIRTIMTARNEDVVADPALWKSNSGELIGLTHLFSGYPVFSKEMKEIEIRISPVFSNKMLCFSLMTTSHAVKEKLLDRDKLWPNGDIACHTCLGISFEGIGVSLVTLLHGRPIEQESTIFKAMDPMRLPSCFVPSGANHVSLDILWDKAQITNREQSVLEGLHILDSRIEKIFFIAQRDHRIPMCQLSGQTQPIPLRNLGGGVIRLLEILLSLVNTQNGVLLIDEFENGLHYTIQPKAWEVIFRMADLLNVQVFATTHSEDAVRAFQQTAMQQENEKAGVILQLAKRKEKIIANSHFGRNLELMYRAEEDLR